MAEPVPKFIPAATQGKGLSVAVLNSLTELSLKDYKRARRRAKKDRKVLVEASAKNDAMG